MNTGTHSTTIKFPDEIEHHINRGQHGDSQIAALSDISITQQEFWDQYASVFGAKSDDFKLATSISDDNSGVVHLKFTQVFAGRKVYAGIVSLTIGRHGSVIHAFGNPLRSLELPHSAFNINPNDSSKYIADPIKIQNTITAYLALLFGLPIDSKSITNLFIDNESTVPIDLSSLSLSVMDIETVW